MSSIEVLELFRDSIFPKSWPCGKVISPQLVMTKSRRGGDNPIDLETRELQDEGLGFPQWGEKILVSKKVLGCCEVHSPS